MEPTTQKLVHTFGALADLGQEITDSSDFSRMVLTSLHLLLGALAIRRGAIAEYASDESALKFVATRGLDGEFPETLALDDQAKTALLSLELSALTLETLKTEQPALDQVLEYCAASTGIRLIVPMVVRSELVGVVLLGDKATTEPFTPDDLEIISSMVRHIGVGIHTHRLLEQVAQRAEENRRLYEDLRAIYRDTVRAFAAAIDIKDKYTQGDRKSVV